MQRLALAADAQPAVRLAQQLALSRQCHTLQVERGQGQQRLHRGGGVGVAVGVHAPKCVQQQRLRALDARARARQHHISSIAGRQANQRVRGSLNLLQTAAAVLQQARELRGRGAHRLAHRLARLDASPHLRLHRLEVRAAPPHLQTPLLAQQSQTHVMPRLQRLDRLAALADHQSGSRGRHLARPQRLVLQRLLQCLQLAAQGGQVLGVTLAAQLAQTRHHSQRALRVAGAQLFHGGPRELRRMGEVLGRQPQCEVCVGVLLQGGGQRGGQRIHGVLRADEHDTRGIAEILLQHAHAVAPLQLPHARAVVANHLAAHRLLLALHHPHRVLRQPRAHLRLGRRHALAQALQTHRVLAALHAHVMPPPQLLQVLAPRPEEGAAHVRGQRQRQGRDACQDGLQRRLRRRHALLLSADGTLQMRFVDSDVCVRAALHLLHLLPAVIQQDR